LELEEINYICGKMARTATMDGGFTVLIV